MAKIREKQIKKIPSVLRMTNVFILVYNNSSRVCEVKAKRTTIISRDWVKRCNGLVSGFDQRMGAFWIYRLVVKNQHACPRQHRLQASKMGRWLIELIFELCFVLNSAVGTVEMWKLVSVNFPCWFLKHHFGARQ